MNYKFSIRNYLQFLPGIIIATLLFGYLTGFKILNVNYYEWLNGYDTTQHYLGWLFFKDGDIFQKFAGANPNYGYETSGSIVYTDSIPILAIFLKTFFKDYLSQNFQYFGIWLLFCFIAQSVCSLVLLKKFTDNFYWQFLGSLFFVFSTPMIFRIFYCEHYALAAHFLILIAFTLYFSKDFSLWRWMLLLIMTLGIHFYIFVIIFFIFSGDLLQRILIAKTTWVEKINFLLEKMLFAFFAIIFFMWQYGYFAIGVENSAADLYGYANINLLSLFDSEGWSKIWPDIKETRYAYEGFCYLGIGIILMLLIIFCEKIFSKTKTHSTLKITLNHKNILPLLSAMIVLTLIALTHHILLGDKVLFIIPIPQTLEVMLGILRASGRMFWPCYYLILLFAILAIIKLAKKYNFSDKKVTILLACLVFVQILDLSYGLYQSKQTLKSHYVNESLDKNLKDDFWQVAKTKYKKIIFLPVLNIPENYSGAAYFAAINHLKTNSGYFARINERLAKASNVKHKSDFRKGIFEEDAIYIFTYKNLYKEAVSKTKKNDFVKEIDGYKVIAPNFKAE